MVQSWAIVSFNEFGSTPRFLVMGKAEGVGENWHGHGKYFNLLILIPFSHCYINRT
jgi:hypothetical protein